MSRLIRHENPTFTALSWVLGHARIHWSWRNPQTTLPCWLAGIRRWHCGVTVHLPVNVVRMVVSRADMGQASRRWRCANARCDRSHPSETDGSRTHAGSGFTRPCSRLRGRPAEKTGTRLGVTSCDLGQSYYVEARSQSQLTTVCDFWGGSACNLNCGQRQGQQKTSPGGPGACGGKCLHPLQHPKSTKICFFLF